MHLSLCRFGLTADWTVKRDPLVISMDSFLVKTIGRFSEAARATLMRRIAWFAGDQQHAGSSATKPWILLLGREYYREYSERFAISSWTQLRSAMALRCSHLPHTYFFIGPLIDGHRVVRFYEIDTTIVSANQHCWFWLPETLALDHSLEPSKVFDIERLGLRYFLVAKVSSQISGGVLASREVFALAAGVSDSDFAHLREPELLPKLTIGLRRLPLSAWINLLNRSRTSEWFSQAKPKVAFVLAGLLLYMFLASTYLYGVTTYRQKQLDGLGENLEQLLDQQRRVDEMSTSYEALSRLVLGRTTTFPSWEYAKPIWDAGGSVIGLSVTPGTVVIRGSTSSATGVLESISSLPSVRSAKFAAPVNSDGGRQIFSIQVVPKEPRA